MDTYLQIADQIKKEVHHILLQALSGTNMDYRYEDGSGKYIRWGRVERDINKSIDNNLTREE